MIIGFGLMTYASMKYQEKYGVESYEKQNGGLKRDGG